MSTQMNKAIAEYFKTQPVVKAWLFGSFARGEETPLSDVDLLVQYDEDGISLLKHAAMICELEKLLDRPVDIVEDGTLRPRVRESVNQDRKLIYERTLETVTVWSTSWKPSQTFSILPTARLRNKWRLTS